MVPDPSLRDGAAEYCECRASTLVSESSAETEPETVVLLLQEPPPVDVRAAGGHLVHDGHVALRCAAGVGAWGVTECVEAHPRLDREIAARDAHVRCIASVYVTVNAVQEKRLSHFAGSECRAALQRAVVTVDDVAGDSLARPPAHQTRGRRASPHGDSDRTALHYRTEGRARHEHRCHNLCCPGS